MRKKPFASIQNAPAPRLLTQRDVDIIAVKIEIMTRQNGDLAAKLAEAEAVNRQLIAEHQQLRAELDTLKKGKKG